MSGDLFITLVGCVFQWGVLACVSRSFMVSVEFGRWSNFSFIFNVGCYVLAYLCFFVCR